MEVGIGGERLGGGSQHSGLVPEQNGIEIVVLFCV